MSQIPEYRQEAKRVRSAGFDHESSSRLASRNVSSAETSDAEDDADATTSKHADDEQSVEDILVVNASPSIEKQALDNASFSKRRASGRSVGAHSTAKSNQEQKSGSDESATGCDSVQNNTADSQDKRVDGNIDRASNPVEDEKPIIIDDLYNGRVNVSSRDANGNSRSNQGCENEDHDREYGQDHDHDHDHDRDQNQDQDHSQDQDQSEYYEEVNDGDEHEDEDDGEDDEEILDGDVESTKEEIEELESLIPGLADQYKLLGKIGEGTFSTVYKAIDLQHDRYDNNSWTMIFSSNKYNAENEQASEGECALQIRSRRKAAQSQQRRARIVAIKKIYVTSSPVRIANEISILNDLRGSKYIAPLVTAMRKEDQVVVVLPYFANDDFRRFYLDLPLEEMRWYFSSLLGALAFTHSKGIMHRDIKPSNFLYDVRRRHGVLVDFGLAEREGDQEAVKYRSRHALQMDSSTAERLFRDVDKRGRPGVPRRDTRPGLRANRAGTRGFRAPEVLLKIPQQSVSIDIWSVGVILLCFLTRRFPFFQSTDDTEALLEIAVLYGRLEMERAAVALGRTFLTNIPTVKDRGIRFESLTKAYNAEGYSDLPPEVFDLLRRLLALTPSQRITAEQALEHPFIANRSTN
ncbi:Cell division control protein 7 [Coemansia sp. RSA 1721]|nr:Cell division control protein 7 [Coemansia sp. RSA 1721]